MRQRRVDTLLVTDDDGYLKGYLDLADLDKYNRVTSVSDLMITKLFKIYTDTLIRNSAERILKQGLRYVPVIDHQGKLRGIVTRSSLVDMVYDIIWGGNDTEADSLAVSAEGGESK
jgi:osmoprotectant transport system ATP-binding protein